MATSNNQDQQHPLWPSDRQIVNTLLNAQPDEYHMAELARLRIRYQGFPGARDIQTDLDTILQQWQLTEEKLFEKTREIHQKGNLYKGKTARQEDWS